MVVARYTLKTVNMVVASYSKCFENIVWVDAAFDKLQISVTNLCHVLGLSVNDFRGHAFDIEVVVTKMHLYFER